MTSYLVYYLELKKFKLFSLTVESDKIYIKGYIPWERINKGINSRKKLTKKFIRSVEFKEPITTFGNRNLKPESVIYFFEHLYLGCNGIVVQIIENV
jgi:hypothetical protein